jgi:hypothetical protein
VSPFANNPPIWPFPPNWRNRFTDRREWRTDVIRNPVAAEQRRALRRVPRRTYEFSLVLTRKMRAVFDNAMMRHAASTWLMPVWYDGRRLTEVAATGARTVVVQNTDHFDGGVPVRGVILEPSTLTAEEVYVLSASNGEIVLRDPLQSTHSINARFYPAVEMHMAESPSVQRLTDETWTATVQFLGVGERFLDAGPGIVDGPMVRDGLAADEFSGLAAYGSARWHMWMVRFMLSNSAVLRANGDVATADVLLNRALEMADAMIGPILRQTPTSDADITIAHNIGFAAKGDLPSERIAFDVALPVVNNAITIPGGLRGRYVTRVFSIHPVNAIRVSDDPNGAAMIGTTRADLRISSWSTRGDNTVLSPLPGGVLNGQTWMVNYAYRDGSFTPISKAHAPVPLARALSVGSVVCDPGSFQALLEMLEELITGDPRPGAATFWTQWRESAYLTIEKINRQNDGRQVIAQRPGEPVVPPDGFFCGADHPSAKVPVGAGLKQSWRGHAFWRRDTNGDVFAVVPAAPNRARVRYGRLFYDKVRLATAYQDADHFLHVAMSCSIKPSEPDQVLVFLSSSDLDDETARWYVNVAPYTAFVAGTGPGSVVNLLVPVGDFRKLSVDSNGNPVWGATMPAGQRVRAFGVEVRSAASYEIRIRSMRLVGGSSASWVTSNLTAALRGAPVPYSPGAMQNRVSFNATTARIDRPSGRLFVGDQCQAAWQRARVTSLDSAVAAFYGTQSVMVSSRLSVLNGSNALAYTMSHLTSAAVTKARIALLNEQGLRFLQRAQDEHVARGGPRGPMANSLVLNFPETTEAGVPTPFSWTYSDPERPDADLVRHQSSAVLSAAYTAWLAASNNYATVREVGAVISVDWLTWLNTAWDGLGSPPRRVPDPAVSGPISDADDPCVASEALAAATLIKATFPTTHDAVCNSVITKAWGYLESLRRTTGVMAGTWSVDPARRLWSSREHAALSGMLQVMHDRFAALPAGLVTKAAIRARMAALASWLDANTRNGWVNTLPDGQAVFEGRTVLVVPPDYREASPMDYESFIETIDAQVGPVYRVDTAGRVLPAWRYSWFLRGRAAHAAFSRFLDAVKGRSTSFWLPTFANDLQLVETVTGSATEIVVRYAALADTNATRDAIMVQMRDGTRYFRRIIGGMAGNTDIEAITIDAPFGTTITPAAVLRVSFMSVARLDQDGIEITHETDSEGVSTVSAMIREAPVIRREEAAFSA